MLDQVAFTGSEVRTRFGAFQEFCRKSETSSQNCRFANVYPQAFDWLYCEKDPDAFEAGLWALARVLNKYPEDFVSLFGLSLKSSEAAELTLALFSRLGVLHREAILPEQFGRIRCEDIPAMSSGSDVFNSIRELSRSEHCVVSLSAHALLIQTGEGGSGESGFFSGISEVTKTELESVKDPLLRRRIAVLGGVLLGESDTLETLADPDGLISTRMTGLVLEGEVTTNEHVVLKALTSDDPRVAAALLHGFRVYSSRAKLFVVSVPLAASLIEQHLQSPLRYMRNATLL